MFPLFPLGQIVATPGALAALERAKQPPSCFLARHAIGDWGELEPTDVTENEYSVAHGFRLLSCYQTNAGEKIWIIKQKLIGPPPRCFCRRNTDALQGSNHWQAGAKAPDDILLLFAYTGSVIKGTFSGLPHAWVVRCKKCSCTITCRAVDPQIEHAEPDKSEPAPQHAVLVSCSCCWTAFRYSPTEVFKGQPSPSNTCSEHRSGEASIKNQEEKRSNAVILIAASLIAAVRLNREEIRPSPSVTAKIADGIRLAEMIQARLRH